MGFFVVTWMAMSVIVMRKHIHLCTFFTDAQTHASLTLSHKQTSHVTQASCVMTVVVVMALAGDLNHVALQ